MSLTGATNAAVSAMKAQSAALSIISNNLANVSTTGFKASTASFSSLLTSTGSDTDVSGGVTAASKSNVTASGLLASTSSATDIAINGSGFFAVSTGSDDSEIYYTRDGSFDIDDDGLLENNGYYLLGWPTDTDGNVVGGSTMSNLSEIDTDDISSYAAATTELTLDGNLPANAEVGDSYSTDEIEVYDSLGSSMLLSGTWTKTGDNTWTLSFSDPVSADDGSTLGTVSTSSITLAFNEDGSLASTDPDPATLTITGLTTGASDLSIALDLGTAGASDGVTQLSDNDGTLSSTVSASGDGVGYGTLSGVSIDEDGTVMASYSNNASIAIYKIPVATFANANGLTEMSNSIYAASADSSGATFHAAGTDGVGSIEAYELESSTTDTSTEFSNMIAAQQAYSAAAQVVTTGKDMFDTLLQAVR